MPGTRKKKNCYPSSLNGMIINKSNYYIYYGARLPKLYISLARERSQYLIVSNKILKIYPQMLTNSEIGIRLKIHLINLINW